MVTLSLIVTGTPLSLVRYFPCLFVLFFLMSSGHSVFVHYSTRTGVIKPTKPFYCQTPLTEVQVNISYPVGDNKAHPYIPSKIWHTYQKAEASRTGSKKLVTQVKHKTVVQVWPGLIVIQHNGSFIVIYFSKINYMEHGFPL